MSDVPALILSVTVWTYWSAVLALALVTRWRYRAAPGVLPRKRSEQVIWPFWIAAVIGWSILPWLALKNHHPLLTLPEWARSRIAVHAVRLPSAVVAVMAFLGTVHCWLQMGRNWGMAVVPGRRTELVRSGLFAFVRHPIYALSIVLMLSSVVVIPTPAMLAAALVHVVLLRLKARGEEQFLHAFHGPAYADYCRATSRFFPRLLPRSESARPGWSPQH
jgi:protein-S-isoprenylcysteine O-methyltransferase Ste14